MTDDHNEDWLRSRSWDLPTSYAGLLSVLGVVTLSEARQLDALAEFIKLPAARAMPSELAAQVNDKLRTASFRQALAHSNRLVRVKTFAYSPALDAARITARRLCEFKDFDEGKHPRDEHGRFSDGGAGEVPTPALGDLPEASRARVEDYAKRAGVTLDSAKQEARRSMEAAKQSGAWTAGIGWYSRERDAINATADKYGLDRNKLYGVTAAMSPHTAWALKDGTRYNLDLAARLSQIVEDDHTFTIDKRQIDYWNDPDRRSTARMDLSQYEGVRKASDLPSDVLARVIANATLEEGGKGFNLYTNIEKGVRIARGEDPDDVLSGTKVRAFYNQFVTDGNSKSSVIDAHMYGALTGRTVTARGGLHAEEGTADIHVLDNPGPLKGQQKFTTYTLFDQATRDVAQEYGVRVSDAQAVIWYQHQLETGSWGGAALREGNVMAVTKVGRYPVRAGKPPRELDIFAFDGPDPDMEFEDENGRHIPTEGVREAKGEGPGHPFRGNQWTGGGVPPDEDPNTPGTQITGYHTTSKEALDAIRENGFDPNAPRNLGNLYGRGIYASLNTEYGRETQRIMLPQERLDLQISFDKPVLYTPNRMETPGLDGVLRAAGIDRTEYHTRTDQLEAQGVGMYEARAKAVSQLVQEKGYDAIVVRADMQSTDDSLAWDQVVVFDKDQVKVLDPATKALPGMPTGERNVVLQSIPAFLASLDPSHQTKGDVAGHAFHGNQWTGGGGERPAGYVVGLTGLAREAQESGTLNPFKTIHEAALGYDELGSVADALGKDSVTDRMVQRASAQITLASQRALERDGYPAQFMVYRTGDVQPDRVESVSLRPLGTFGNPKTYEVNRSDVLTYGEALQRGTFAEAELHIRGSDLREAKGDLPGHEFHGNQWTGGRGGGPEVVTGTSVEGIARKMGAYELEHGQTMRPDRYVEHPRSGFLVERPGTVIPELQEGPDRYGKPPRIADRVAPEFGHFTDPKTSGLNERPPDHLFRAVSEEEYQGIIRNGHMQSDGRMNLSADEGTVTAISDPSYYLPGHLYSQQTADPSEHYDGRIVRIDYRDDDGWKLDSDGYIKTNQQVPAERISAVSPVIAHYPATGTTVIRDAEGKGDVVGHPFHGNQWTGGQGGEAHANEGPAWHTEAERQEQLLARQTEEMRARMHRLTTALPNAKPDMLWKMDPVHQETLVARAEHFAERYPKAAAAIGTMKLADLGGAVAAVKRVPGRDEFTMLFDRDRFVHYHEQLEEAMRTSYEKHFHPYDSVASTLDHEFGHVLAGHLAKAGAFDPVDELFNKYTDKGRDDFPKFSREYLRGLGGMNGYAGVGGPHEAFAEMFAMHELGQDSKMTPAARELVGHAVTEGETKRTGWQGNPVPFPDRTCEGFIPLVYPEPDPEEFKGEGPGHAFHGNQWTGGTGTMDRPETSHEAAGAMQTALRVHGGFTVDPHTGRAPTTGYMVAIPGHALDPPPTVEAFTNMSDEELTDLVDGWLLDNADAFNRPGAYIGGWADGGLVYLEPSEHIEDHAEAVKAGIERGQKAIWDNANGAEITTGDTAAKSARSRAGTPADRRDERRRTTRLRGARGAGDQEGPDELKKLFDPLRGRVADARFKKHEAAFAAMLTKFLDNHQAVTMHRLKGPKSRMGTRHWSPPGETKVDAAKVVNLPRWRQELMDDAHPLMVSLYTDVGEDTLTSLGRSMGVTLGEIDPELPSIADSIRARENLLGDASETLSGRIRDAIAKGEDAGEDLATIADRVQSIYGDADDWWADQIAGDEVAGGTNAAASAAVDASGLSGIKRWISQGDERVRPTHVAADGQEVAFDETFTVGNDQLRYPHDEEGSPEETVNCRCVLGWSFDQPKSLKADWDESLHPRGWAGRFGDAAGPSTGGFTPPGATLLPLMGGTAPGLWAVKAPDGQVITLACSIPPPPGQTPRQELPNPSPGRKPFVPASPCATDAQARKLLSTLAGLYMHFPTNPAIVANIVDAETAARESAPNAMAYCYLEANKISFVAPTVAVTDTADRSPNGLGDGVRAVGIQRYVAMHEYGHAYQPLDGSVTAVHDAVKALPNAGGLSEYGQSNPVEGYAEAFADFMASGGKPTNVATKVYQEHYGWR